MRSQRCYILWVNEHDIMTLFQLTRLRNGSVSMANIRECRDNDGNHVCVPGDVNMTGATYDYARGAFGIRLEHAEFPEIPDGMIYPSIYPDQFTFVDRKATLSNPGNEIIFDELQDDTTVHFVEKSR